MTGCHIIQGLNFRLSLSLDKWFETLKDFFAITLVENLICVGAREIDSLKDFQSRLAEFIEFQTKKIERNLWKG